MHSGLLLFSVIIYIIKLYETNKTNTPKPLFTLFASAWEMSPNSKFDQNVFQIAFW